jgi:beta-lactamase regulating signal transducer with metallopeptidase domain
MSFERDIENIGTLLHSLRHVQAQLRVQLRLWFMNYLGLLYVFTPHLHILSRHLSDPAQ